MPGVVFTFASLTYRHSWNAALAEQREAGGNRVKQERERDEKQNRTAKGKATRGNEGKRRVATAAAGSHNNALMGWQVKARPISGPLGRLAFSDFVSL